MGPRTGIGAVEERSHSNPAGVTPRFHGVQPAVTAAFKISDSILGIDTVNGREGTNDASAKTVIFGVFEVRNL